MKLDFPDLSKKWDKTASDKLVKRKLTEPITFRKWSMPPVVDLDRFLSILIQGRRGSGKSALGSKMLEQFFYGGRVCISLTEAPYSYESMFTAIPGPYQDKSHPCIFVVPEDCNISWPEDKYDIITMDVTVPLKTVLLTAKNEKRIIVFCHSLWEIEDEVKAYKNMAAWINQMHRVQRTLKTDMAILLREVEMQGYSRIKSSRSSKELKSALLDLIRLARSSYRMSVIADLQLTSDLDKALRNQVDVFLFKKQNPLDLPDSLKWVNQTIKYKRRMLMHNPLRDRLFPDLSHLYQKEFYYAQPDEQRIWKLETGLPDHHHKTEREDLTDYGFRFTDQKLIATGDIKLDEFSKRYAGYESVRQIPQSTRILIANEAHKLVNQDGYSWHSLGKALNIDHKNIMNWVNKFAS